MPSPLRLLAPAALLATAACSVGPDFHRPDTTLPGSWSFDKSRPIQPADPAKLAGWWKQFHDPDLDRLVTRALDGNLDLAQATARLQQARASRQAAIAPFWPWLAASGGETQTHTHGAGHTTTDHGSLSAAWELDLFGGNRRNSEAADARFAYAIADLDATRLAITAETASGYCQLRALQDQLAVAKANLATQEHSADITRERRTAGFASDLDVANATAQVSGTRAQIPSLETATSQSAHALSLLIGCPPAELNQLLLHPRPVPTARTEVPTGIPSDLLRRRPDILRAEAGAHAATARIGVAVANLFPKFSLSGSINQQSSKLSDWLSPSARSSSFGPSFNWAIFQAGNLQADIRLQKALRDESVLAYRKSVLTALQEVEDSMTAGRNERKRNNSLADAVAANRKAVDLSVKLYAAGQSDFLNVLNAQRSLLQSENELSQSRLALANDLIALYKALGGGW